MARTIKYRAQCYKCKNWFESGKAFLHRISGKWKCHCFKCYEDSKNAK